MVQAQFETSIDHSQRAVEEHSYVPIDQDRSLHIIDKVFPTSLQAASMFCSKLSSTATCSLVNTVISNGKTAH